MQALIVVAHIVFPLVTLLMALPIITDAVPGWLAMGEQLSGEQLLVLVGLGIPVYVGLASGPGYSYYVVQDVIQGLNWRRAGGPVRIWVRLSLIALAFASAIGFLWMVVFFGPVSICPLATTVLCVLGLKGGFRGRAWKSVARDSRHSDDGKNVQESSPNTSRN